jgi:glycosyltransferase involved in cell wall biosynthesis
MNAFSNTLATTTQVLFHDYGGHAFTAQLARGMARLGHRSTYVSFAEFATPKGRVGGHDIDPPGFDAQQLSIGQAFDKENLIKRSRQQVAYARLAAQKVLADRPTIVVSSNSPLEVQAHMMKACRRVGAKFVFWMQDVHSEAIARILGRRNALLGQLAGGYYANMEKRLLKGSDHVVTIADDFTALIGPSGWGVPSERMDVIENWAPLEDIPLHPRDNDWALHNFRPGRRRIVYSGTLARKHNPEILVKLAQRVDADIHLFSAGSGADHVKARALELGLGNLFVRPWVTVDELPKMLAGADILTAFIEKDAGVFSVPSKVLSYLAAGRPILASIPHENLATRNILKAEAGLVSEPGDDEAMLRNAEALLAAPELRETLGRNGRAHAEAHFDIDRISRRFEQIIARVEQGR